MRICFISRDSPEQFFNSGKNIESDIYCFSFGSVGEVSYSKELSGETQILENLTEFSKRLKKVMICGVYTDLYGVKNKSVAVADRGKLLGIADRNNNFSDKGFSSGSGLKIFPTSCGKIGIAVCEDLFFPEVIKSLSLCGSDVVIGVIEKWKNSVENSSVRANSYAYGIASAVSSIGYAFGVDSFGSVSFATGKNYYNGEVSVEKRYRQLTEKRRGFSKK